MKIYIMVPKKFVPVEREFQMYCAVKLYKKEYINKEEAIKMCGYNEINKNTENKFQEICNLFEQRYKNICGKSYCDSDFMPDDDNLSNIN